MDNFKEQVKKMREAQKAYFKERTADNLQNAKFWEKRVDAALEAPKEPTLF